MKHGTENKKTSKSLLMNSEILTLFCYTLDDPSQEKLSERKDLQTMAFGGFLIKKKAD